MSEIITKETVETLIKGSEGMVELAKQGSTTLIDETIKLYIFYGVLGILKAAVVFIVFGVVMKFLNTVDHEGTNKAAKAAKTAALIISIIYFTVNTIPHLQDIGKAMVAPNLFVAEKGLELLKKVK